MWEKMNDNNKRKKREKNYVKNRKEIFQEAKFYLYIYDSNIYINK
jgi:hypothetical protein